MVEAKSERDGNTHFFHIIALARHRSNRINRVSMEDGSLTDQPNLINEAFFQFFRQKWTASVPSLMQRPPMMRFGLLSKGWEPIELWGMMGSLHLSTKIFGIVLGLMLLLQLRNSFSLHRWRSGRRHSLFYYPKAMELTALANFGQ